MKKTIFNTTLGARILVLSAAASAANQTSSDPDSAVAEQIKPEAYIGAYTYALAVPANKAEAAHDDRMEPSGDATSSINFSEDPDFVARGYHDIVKDGMTWAIPEGFDSRNYEVKVIGSNYQFLVNSAPSVCTMKLGDSTEVLLGRSDHIGRQYGGTSSFTLKPDGSGDMQWGDNSFNFREIGETSRTLKSEEEHYSGSIAWQTAPATIEFSKGCYPQRPDYEHLRLHWKIYKYN